ncbi:hypothetical protein E2K98_06540 [Bacillus salipaludis]|uniref:YfjL-like N-terminal domain-containing protein n=1 Tax=Bacillus salipaludis TaxID=2547811 RepID=A0A4R5VV93_9BACI|nr:hypothetical protein [Bacillus salipaludis]MDQ6597467.1 hypothetical protein [Bacillus salipaludis]TDK63108.1 hypothetical protein E2K98_06540 [Bacillus salipaludis]
MHIRFSKVFIWIISFLIVILSLFVYSGFNGTPWEKHRQSKNMTTYLTKKYHNAFIIKNIDYNFLSETYQAYSYPKGHPELVFTVEEDEDASAGYSDTFPKVFWESELSSNLKKTIKGLFPHLDKTTFTAERIVDRGEYFGPHIPTYQKIYTSQLACSITIYMKTKWEKVKQATELEKVKRLSHHLKSIHFPVLIQVTYYEKARNENDKVFFITEDGRIVEN